MRLRHLCDARGRTTSVAAIAIRRGAKVATLIRPNATGDKAWGPNLGNGEWDKDMREKKWQLGMDLNIDGTDVPWSALGQNMWSPDNPEGKQPHSKYQGDEESDDAYVQGTWFAQPLFIKDGRDKNNAHKPMCVGDVERNILVKASVPKVHQIYEPVVTLELAHDLVQNLQPDGVCMGPNAQSNVEVGYEHSIFTVAQLYQLCSVCGMLEDGGSNRADPNGWVVTDGAKGCIHPPAESKPRSGADICEENHMLATATTECSKALNPDSESEHERFWFDSCLAECCNAGDSAAVHELVSAVHEEVETEFSNIENEYGANV